MKFMITSVISLLLGIQCLYVQGQDLPKFPKEDELKTKEDYVKYEPLVKETAEWLEETDLDKQVDVRMMANAFIIRWLSGSPTVTIEIEAIHSKLADKNPQLLAIFLARYCSYCIANNSYKNSLEPTKAGLLAMVKVYKKGIAVKKDKAIEKLGAAVDEGKLDDYIAKNFKTVHS